MATLAALARTRPGPPRTFPRAVLLDGIVPADDTGTGEALDEAEVAELASRLLDARSEAERDHLLAATLTHAAHRAGGALTAPLGRALGGALKAVAARALDGPGPGHALGMELEGLDAGERAFEAAQRFVRLAGEAARHAVEEGEMAAPPRRMALAALAAAADAYAPALLPPLALHPERSGTWVRRDGVIEVHGATRLPVPRLADLRPGPSALRIEPFEYDPEMEYFLGGLVRSVGRAVGSVAHVASKAADAVGKIPILGDVARAGIGAARLGLGPAAIAIDAGSRLARGQSLGAALKGAVVGQVDAVRDQLKLAEMVAPFVPGIGTGVAAALGAANALAAGRPITEAVLAAARSAMPGGAVAQAAFDVALNLAKGKNLGEAALAAARERLPGGPAARAAFDGAVALAQGKRLQDAAFAAAGRVLPPSPYAADALAFVQRVANGQNLQHAALSVAGQRAMRQIRGGAALTAPLPGAAAAQSALRAATHAARRGNAGWHVVRGMQRGLPASTTRVVARGKHAALPGRAQREIALESEMPKKALPKKAPVKHGPAAPRTCNLWVGFIIDTAGLPPAIVGLLPVNPRVLSGGRLMVSIDERIAPKKHNRIKFGPKTLSATQVFDFHRSGYDLTVAVSVWPETGKNRATTNPRSASISTSAVLADAKFNIRRSMELHNPDFKTYAGGLFGILGTLRLEYQVVLVSPGGKLDDELKRHGISKEDCVYQSAPKPIRNTAGQLIMSSYDIVSWGKDLAIYADSYFKGDHP